MPPLDCMTKIRGTTEAEARPLLRLFAALKGRSSTLARFAARRPKATPNPSLVRIDAITCAGEAPAAPWGWAMASDFASRFSR